jgi:acyl-CoA oxidase
MMMKMTNVSKEGKVSQSSGDPRVMYSSMMLIRTRIISEMHQRMFEGLAIALRYAVVRRQFATIHKSTVERQIIDY